MDTQLFAISPSLSTLTDAWTVPAGPRRFLQRVQIAVAGGSDITGVKITYAPAGAADAAAHLKWMGTVKGDGSTGPIPINTRVKAGDKIRVYTTAAATFTGFGA